MRPSYLSECTTLKTFVWLENDILITKNWKNLLTNAVITKIRLQFCFWCSEDWEWPSWQYMQCNLCCLLQEAQNLHVNKGLYVLQPPPLFVSVVRPGYVNLTTLMQCFHWNRQAGNYAFLEGRDQCLQTSSTHQKLLLQYRLQVWSWGSVCFSSPVCLSLQLVC